MIESRVTFQLPCEACGGEGRIEEMRYVTRDMATDAGEPSMEGMPIPDYHRCPDCGGSGSRAALGAKPETGGGA